MTNENGRQLSLNQAYTKFEKVLDEQGVTDGERRVGTMAFIDGHKYGYRAAAGALFIALGVVLDGDFDEAEDYRDAIGQLRDAVKESAR